MTHTPMRLALSTFPPTPTQTTPHLGLRLPLDSTTSVADTSGLLMMLLGVISLLLVWSLLRTLLRSPRSKGALDGEAEKVLSRDGIEGETRNGQVSGGGGQDADEAASQEGCQEGSPSEEE